MRTFVDDRVKGTREYVKYLFEELIKHAPFTRGANIEIPVIEGKTPFPEIVEIPEGAPNKKKMSKEVHNWDVRHPGRFALFWDFTKEILEPMCTVLESVLQPEIKLDMLLNVVINDPEKIYAKCKKLGIKIPDEDDLLKELDPNTAKFLENSPRIMWLGQVVPIEYGKLQYDVCQYAFGRKVDDVISWDEVVEKADKAMLRDTKKALRSIRFAVYDINSKIQKICGKPLFVWKNKSFFRVA
jgi:hypothetical protein